MILCDLEQRSSRQFVHASRLQRFLFRLKTRDRSEGLLGALADFLVVGAAGQRFRQSAYIVCDMDVMDGVFCVDMSISHFHQNFDPKWSFWVLTTSIDYDRVVRDSVTFKVPMQRLCGE